MAFLYACFMLLALIACADCLMVIVQHRLGRPFFPIGGRNSVRKKRGPKLAKSQALAMEEGAGRVRTQLRALYGTPAVPMTWDRAASVIENSARYLRALA